MKEQILELIEYYKMEGKEPTDPETFKLILNDLKEENKNLNVKDFLIIYEEFTNIDFSNLIENKSQVQSKDLRKEYSIADRSIEEEILSVDEKFINKLIESPEELTEKINLIQQKLPGLLTDEHFYEFAGSDGKSHKGISSYFTRDILYILDNFEVKPTIYEERILPDGTVLLLATATVKDLKRNRSYSSTVTEVLVDVIEYEDGSKDYNKHYENTYEIASTRAQRNATEKLLIPPKIIDEAIREYKKIKKNKR